MNHKTHAPIPAALAPVGLRQASLVVVSGLPAYLLQTISISIFFSVPSHADPQTGPQQINRLDVRLKDSI
jgi:membrane-bound metal-dependent hydrolase YbcI (DUF457 family)